MVGDGLGTHLAGQILGLSIPDAWQTTLRDGIGTLS